jgi:dihydroorotate dehydrogenase
MNIAPGISDYGIGEIADLTFELGLHAIVATNTTVSRDGLITTGFGSAAGLYRLQLRRGLVGQAHSRRCCPQVA